MAFNPFEGTIQLLDWLSPDIEWKIKQHKDRAKCVIYATTEESPVVLHITCKKVALECHDVLSELATFTRILLKRLDDGDTETAITIGNYIAKMLEDASR